MSKSPEFYNKCMACEGTGRRVPENGKTDWTCPICQGEKYLPAGINKAQVDMMHRAYQATLPPMAQTPALVAPPEPDLVLISRETAETARRFLMMEVANNETNRVPMHVHRAYLELEKALKDGNS